MKYMAYYLKEAIGIKMTDGGELDFICMHNLKELQKFKTLMELLERQYFGGSHGPL